MNLGSQIVSHLQKLLASELDANKRGRYFEQFCKQVIELSGEIANVKTVWPHNHFPSRNGVDRGVDLWVELTDGAFIAVQCKGYVLTERIRKADIDSFLSASSRLGVVRRLLMTSVTRLSDNARRTISEQVVPVEIYGPERFESNGLVIPENFDLPVVKPEPIELHDYQRLAISSTVAALSADARCVLQMACGTGKTYTLEGVAATIGAGRVVVFAPSIALCQQNLLAWRRVGVPFDALVVCSDDSAGDRVVDDIPVSYVASAVTTDPSVVQRFMDRSSNLRKVIFCTYQSSHALQGIAFDLGIFDEAHVTAGVGAAGLFQHALHDYNVPIVKRVFATATPRVLSPSVRAQAGELAYCMDNVSLYGKTAFQLLFREAIELGRLTPYRIAVVQVTEQQVREVIQTRKFLSVNGTNLDAEQVAGMIATLKAIKKYSLKRVFSFHSNNKRAAQFSSSIRNLKTEVDIDISLETRAVSGLTTLHDREEVFRAMRVELPHTMLISNCRVLGVGIDVPSLDGLVFCDPRSGVVDIVQQVGRVMRKFEGKEIGTLVIPVVITDEDCAAQEIRNSSFNNVVNVIRAVQSHDPILRDFIAKMRLGAGLRNSPLIDFIGSDVIHFDAPAVFTQAFANAIQVAILDSALDIRLAWVARVQEFVEKHNRLPKRASKLREEVIADGGKMHLRSWYHKNQLTPDLIALCEAIPGWVWVTRAGRLGGGDVFEEMWGMCRDFFEIHGEWPSAVAKDIDEKVLGKWFEKARHAHRSGKWSAERIAALEAYPHYTCPIDSEASHRERHARTALLRAECKELRAQLKELGVERKLLGNGTIRKWRAVRDELAAVLQSERDLLVQKLIASSNISAE